MRHTKRELEEIYGESRRDFLPRAFKCVWCGEKYEDEYGQPQDFEGDTICRWCARDFCRTCVECGELYDETLETCPACLDELKKRETAAGEKWTK